MVSTSSFLCIVTAVLVALCATHVHATLPVCPHSLADGNGHYVYTASPQVYITTAASPNMATQSFTVSMWVKPTTQSVTGYSPLVGQGPASGCGGAGAACTLNLLIGYYFDSISTHYQLVLGAGFDQASNPQQLYDSVHAVANVDSDIGQWQLYVFEYNVLGSFRVWRNSQPIILSAGGQLTSAYTGPAAVVALGAAGGSPLSNFFVGSMDEMRIWFGVEIPLIDIQAMWCDNVITSAAGFYMSGVDFLSNGGSAQTPSSPAPGLSGADVTNQCYGFCLAALPCASMPCQNGGNCSYAVQSFNTTTNVTTYNTDSYICQCPIGFSGFNCQTNINECASSPCANGGTCVDGINSFNCSCPAGYTGAMCQTDINECASQPCQNGGLCTDLVNAFSCNCTQPPMPECGACANPTSLPSDLGSQILAPGCYVPTPSTDSFAMTGIMRLRGSGRYQFATTASLNTVANSQVILENGADCRRISWCIVSAVTLGANSIFIGNLKSSAQITVGDTVVITGSLHSDTTINMGAADTLNVCPNSLNQPIFYGAMCELTAGATAGSSSALTHPSSSGVAAGSSSALPRSSSALPLSSSAAAAAPISSSGAAAPAPVSSSAAAAPAGVSSSGASQLSSSAAGAAAAVSSSGSAAVPHVSSSAAAAPGASPSSSAPAAPIAPVSSSAGAALAASSSGASTPAGGPSSSGAALSGACAANPCLHGGLCANLPSNGYECNCTVAIAPNCECLSPVTLSNGDLTGRTLAPGCYLPNAAFDIPFALTGNLMLAGSGSYTFLTRAALNTAASSEVVLSGGSACARVNWCIGGAVTLGAASTFIGNVQTDVAAPITVGASSAVTGTLNAGNLVVTIGASAVVNACPNPNANGDLSPVIAANHFAGAQCQTAPPIVVPQHLHYSTALPPTPTPTASSTGVGGGQVTSAAVAVTQSAVVLILAAAFAVALA